MTQVLLELPYNDLELFVKNLDLALIYVCVFKILKDLITDLTSELSHRFRQTILGLMMPPAEYDAHELNKAIRVLISTETLLG